MTYYRVRKEFDQRRKHPHNPKDYDILVADELYTEHERKQLKIPDEAFEQVEVPKSQTYWFFGARFQQKESPWRHLSNTEAYVQKHTNGGN